MNRDHARWVALLAVLALAASAVWVISDNPDRHAFPLPERRGVHHSDDGREIRGPVELIRDEASWTPHRAAGQWPHDVFTAPSLYVDPETSLLTATPPADPRLAPSPMSPWQVDLVRVQSEPFPLQLVGYVGAGVDARGVFERLETGENILAQAGRHFPDLGLTLVRFGVAREQSRGPDGSDSWERIATAVLVDELSGEEIRLTSRERHYRGEPEAILRSQPGGEVFASRTGDQFEIAGARFTLMSITREPPGVLISRQLSDFDGPPEQRALSPVAPVDVPSQLTHHR